MADENKDYYSKEIDEARKWETFYQQAVEELRTAERYRNYFSGFSPSSVEQFINHYASQKVTWYRYGGSHHRWEEKKKKQWYKEAVKLFFYIQQKKVFDMLLRWGNYEVAIPEARSYYDFNKWLCNPFACPYIKLVQADEMNTASRFLRSLDEDERVMHLSHDHSNIYIIPLIGRDNIELDEYYYPLFFRFWDNEYGTPLVRRMPPRIEKEERYIDAWQEHQNQQEPPEPEVENVPKKSSFTYYDNKSMDAFVEAYETAEFKRMYQLEKWWNARNAFSEMVEEEIRNHLSDSPKHIPVESNDDWREAIIQTAEMYAREQILQCLPLVYQEYEERVSNGNNFTDWATDKDFTTNEWYPDYLNDLLQGRQLLGEPANFDF